MSQLKKLNTGAVGILLSAPVCFRLYIWGSDAVNYLFLF